MRLIRNKADVGGLILLAVITLAAAGLALTGREVGLYLLLIIPGIGLGLGLAYLTMRRWGANKRVALALIGATLLVLFLLPLVGLWLGVEWLVFPWIGFSSPLSGFFFGMAMGIGQWAFSTLMGFYPPVND